MTEARDEASRLLQAAGWRMRSEAGEADAEALAHWLADEHNAAAWERVGGAHDWIGAHASDARMLEFRRAALQAAQKTHRRLRWARWSLKAAACVLLGIGVGATFYHITAPQHYRTAFNARQVVTLGDGSRVCLDSDSEITVRYSRDARELRLLHGQARFDVAHDVLRPFAVSARDQRVVATGTAFNIDLTQAVTRVTLIEGHVRVFTERSHLLASSPAGQPVELHATEQLAATQDEAPVVAPADLHQVTSWTSGQLVFDNQPLSEVVARINHYASRRIVIADARLARLRLSGSFNTGDVDGFLDIVTHYLPVRATTGTDGAVRLSP